MIERMDKNNRKLRTKKLRENIVRLKKERMHLLREIKKLKGKAAHLWKRMTRKQICSMIMLGVVLTSLIVLVPRFFIDPFVAATLPLSTLNQETELVSYLREIQDHKNIYVGLHGYDHKCPSCGAVDHELTCPYSNIPLEEVQHRIEAGLAIFNQSGLKTDWYGFPGMSYDENVLSILRSKGFVTFKYQALGWKELDAVVSSSMINFTTDYSHFQIKEYTWMWRNGVPESHFQAALMELNADKPIQIVMHIQDVTGQTLDLLEYAILHANTTIIRCDDVTSNHDRHRIKQLVDLAEKYDAYLFLAVIPAFKRSTRNSFVDIMLKAVWMLFTGLFVFPIAVMTPWALIFRLKRQKPHHKWNPHYPTVSLILPAYNEEETIAKSIEQGLNQDYEGTIEIIVIDDGSIDRTYEIAKKYADECPDVKIIRHEENKGKSHAVNAGFAEAKGEISVFSDTDSVLAPDAISKMVSHFKDPKVGMVAGMVIIKNEKNLLTRLQQIEYLLNQSIIRFCQSSHESVLICPGACTAVRTHIARKIPLTDRTVTEDADFTFSVLKDGWTISQEPEAISYTKAPENLRVFFDQRKRWLYGGLQTIAIHKWALRKGNLWVMKAWLDCLLCPFALLYLVSIPLLSLLFDPNSLMFFVTYGSVPFVIIGITGAIGIRLYNGSEKSRLVLLMPAYAVYQFILRLLLVYLVLGFASRRGIHIRHGGKIYKMNGKTHSFTARAT